MKWKTLTIRVYNVLLEPVILPSIFLSQKNLQSSMNYKFLSAKAGNFALTYDKRKWNYDLCAQRSLIISTVYHIGESPKYH